MKLGKFKLNGELSLEYKYNGEQYGGAIGLPHKKGFYYAGEKSHIVLENIEEFNLFMQFIEQIAKSAYEEGHIDYEVRIIKRS